MSIPKIRFLLRNSLFSISCHIDDPEEREWEELKIPMFGFLRSPRIMVGIQG
jgi:hypothetical protein